MLAPNDAVKCQMSATVAGWGWYWTFTADNFVRRCSRRDYEHFHILLANFHGLELTQYSVTFSNNSERPAVSVSF